MKRGIMVLAMIAVSLSAFGQTANGGAGNVFNEIPRVWKWISNDEVIFSYDGTYEDDRAFVYNAAKGRITNGVSAPDKFADFPVHPEDAVNLTYSPDSTMLAFTRDNDLYVIDIATSEERRLTFDGTDLILNGYASWVYYEEIFGRPSLYRAFWWSPDSKKIGFYRFDNTEVPLFPIYSPFGQDGTLRQTRYPKAGETNPEVRIGIISCEGLFGSAFNSVLDGSSSESGYAASGDGSGKENGVQIVWADFDPEEDCYYGTPFWGADSKELYIAKMPRVQNTLDLYAVSVSDGSKRHVYNETYTTWVEWISDMLFTDSGLYMVRSFETGWEQIYFLSYGGELRRLTDGENWRTQLVRVDDQRGDVYFIAQRDSRLRSVLYKVDSQGNIVALTDPSMYITSVSFSPGGKYFVAMLSNSQNPPKIIVATTAKAAVVAPAGSSIPTVEGSATAVSNLDNGGTASDSSVSGTSGGSIPEISDDLASGASGDDSPSKSEKKENIFSKVGKIFKPKVTKDFVTSMSTGIAVVADMAGEDYDPEDYAMPKFIWMTTEDGFSLPAQITYPKDFDPQKKYPVHVDIYGGPNTPQVRDRWVAPNAINQWWSENGIIQVIADCRAAGHNGRAGTDMIYRDLISWPVRDFIEWADLLKSLPYVNGDKIGVEGFSFGGSMTAALVFAAPDSYHYGIAGGGVYDWRLYDSHYTERFMESPQTNPDGYETACVLNYAQDYKADYGESRSGVAPVMLRITHGTGDDNVHFQNTLQLIDVLQKYGKEFELMIYPDGMHGYRGAQAAHFNAGNQAFWLRYLKEEK